MTESAIKIIRTVRMDPAVATAVDALAEKQGISASEFLRRAVDLAIAASGPRSLVVGSGAAVMVVDGKVAQGGKARGGNGGGTVVTHITGGAKKKATKPAAKKKAPAKAKPGRVGPLAKAVAEKAAARKRGEVEPRFKGSK